MSESSCCSTSSPAFGVVSGLGFRHSNSMQWYFIVVLICKSLMTVMLIIFWYVYLPSIYLLWWGVSADLLLNFFLASRMACGIVPPPGIKTGPLAAKVPSANHWTSREFPFAQFKFRSFVFLSFSFKSSLHTLDISSLLNMCFAIISSKFMAYPLIFHRAEVLNFNEVQFTASFLSWIMPLVLYLL